MYNHYKVKNEECFYQKKIKTKREVIKMSDDSNEAIQMTRTIREKLLSDRYRPGYHFAIPEDLAIPGDPNGAFFANGRYHLMYLYDRRGKKFFMDSNFCWGHISSCDLIHWRHHPDAIVSGNGDGGCFSGGAFVDEDGTAYISYWALPEKSDHPQGCGIGIAKSCDRHYEKWEKIATIPCTEPGIIETIDSEGKHLYLANADPSNIWKKDGIYYMQAGNLKVLDKYGRDENSPEIYRGDWVDLFKSIDITNWQYVGRFYQRKADNTWTDESEDDMCPSFLPLPAIAEGGEESGKYLQLFISHIKGCQYYIGEYDKKNDMFVPQTHGRMSWVDNTYFAPEALIDSKGRQIMWAWLLDNDSENALEQYGWSGVYGLPRKLWLGDDNTLRLAPVDELKMLRYNKKSFPFAVVHGGEKIELGGINGESCEIELIITPKSAKKVGLKVRTSPEEEEVTMLYFDTETNHLVFDSTKSGIKGRPVKETAPFRLGESEKLKLNVFIDKSVIEIYANDLQAITRRVYPERLDSTGVYMFCEGGDADFNIIQTWEMMPSNPY